MEKDLKKVILSLTSYPPRIATAHLAVQSLLEQTARAEKLVLWLSEADFPGRETALPPDLLALTGKGLAIEWCDNLKSYKKLIPALQKYPGFTVITFDDDIRYDKKTVEELYRCHLRHPGDIVAHRVCRMFLDENGGFDEFPRLMYYRKESKIPDYKSALKEGSFFNHLTGCGGVLYPPGCLHRDVLDSEKCMALAPTNDDLWFWVQGIRNGKKVRVPETHFPDLRDIPRSQESALNNINTASGQNLFSLHLENLVTAYPEVMEVLRAENARNTRILNEIIADSPPVISVICFARNHEARLRESLDRILEQRIMVSFEIIVHAGAPADRRAGIVKEYEARYPRIVKGVYQNNSGSGHTAVLSSLLPLAQGELVAFCEAGDYWTDSRKLRKQFEFLYKFPGFSLSSSGFTEINDAPASPAPFRQSEETAPCGGLKGFEYNGVEVRGRSHWHISTILCRKSALAYSLKKCSGFKYANDTHLVYFLLRRWRGWYFPEQSGVVVRRPPETETETAVIRYKIYKELYRKTKDPLFRKYYYRYLQQILEYGLYKNGTEQFRYRFEFHRGDSQRRTEAVKKFGSVLQNMIRGLCLKKHKGKVRGFHGETRNFEI